MPNNGKRTLDSRFATFAGSLVPTAVAVSAFAATVLATGVGLVALGWVKPASLSLVDRLVKGSRLFRSWGAVAATPAPTGTAGRGLEDVATAAAAAVAAATTSAAAAAAWSSHWQWCVAVAAATRLWFLSRDRSGRRVLLLLVLDL